MNIRFHILLSALLTLAPISFAEDAPSPQEIAVMKKVMKVIGELQYQKGEVSLVGGKAKITLTDQFRYLNEADTAKVLVDIWGNPPEASKTLGMIVENGANFLEDETWGALLMWKPDGYVKDDDFASINFAEMLKDLRESSIESNKERVSGGYGKMILKDWAQPPHYDRATHKLYWAKAFEMDGPELGLNYDIRILGRHGILEVSIISSMGQFKTIEAKAPEILAMTGFTEGNRYEDYKPGDKTAAYGIGALVAGGVLMKSGFFKVLMIGLLKFWKIGAVALVAGAAFIKRIAGGKKAQ